ncbi:MAG: hypothetical protein K0S56_531 [Microvirga sp.]|nr:hypothetical protein [Microvirga sp.]
MALPIWPAAVPHDPTSSSISESHRGNLESEMNAGNVRSRRQFTDVIGVVDMTLRLTTTQFATFKAFVRDTLSHGAADFTMPVWDLTGCADRRVRLRNGGKYSARRGGAKIHVSFSLDVWDL